jgi:hypothetical protein
MPIWDQFALPLPSSDEIFETSGPIELDSRTEMEIKLICLSVHGNLDGVTSIASMGVNLQCKDYNGRTPLHLAAQGGHLHLVEFLIKKGVDIDLQDEMGESAFSLAQKGKHINVQCALQRAGARCGTDSSRPPQRRGSSRQLQASFAIIEACPKGIALAMLDGRRATPIKKECVSLLFADIVGFTNMSSRMDATQVSRLLNGLYTKLDRLAYVHGVQKIDVVGDAYIAAANFAEDQVPHKHHEKQTNAYFLI